MNESEQIDNPQYDGVLPCVMHCNYCDELINESVSYTEDAEPAHEQCIKDFEKHWEDRQETMDLMGY
jgi:hypothetical protein